MSDTELISLNAKCAKSFAKVAEEKRSWRSFANFFAPFALKLTLDRVTVGMESIAGEPARDGLLPFARRLLV